MINAVATHAPKNKFIIDGVYEDFPENGNFHFDIIGSLELLPAYTTDNWNGNDRYFGFVKLQKGVDYQSLGEAIRKMQEAHQPLDEYEKRLHKKLTRANISCLGGQGRVRLEMLRLQSEGQPVAFN